MSNQSIQKQQGMIIHLNIIPPHCRLARWYYFHGATLQEAMENGYDFLKNVGGEIVKGYTHGCERWLEDYKGYSFWTVDHTPTSTEIPLTAQQINLLTA